MKDSRSAPSPSSPAPLARRGAASPRPRHGLGVVPSKCPGRWRHPLATMCAAGPTAQTLALAGREPIDWKPRTRTYDAAPDFGKGNGSAHAHVPSTKPLQVASNASQKNRYDMVLGSPFRPLQKRNPGASVWPHEASSVPNSGRRRPRRGRRAWLSPLGKRVVLALRSRSGARPQKPEPRSPSLSHSSMRHA